MTRVVTLTFNPAIDQTVTLPHLVPGEVHRATSVLQNAGGKGVNVASCLADWGIEVSAYGLLGADNAAPFEALFANKAIADRFERRPGATRINLKLVDQAGTTDINMDGAPVDLEQIEAVIAAVMAEAGQDVLVVLAGSVPPGCPPDVYARIIARLHGSGATTILDTSGEPLRAALDADVLPDVVKPNAHELSEWLGQPVSTSAEVRQAAAQLHQRGVKLVAISLGEDGAFFLSDEGALTAKLAANEIASTVGAGDAMVAGIAAALVEGGDLERVARLSTAFAVGKLGLAGPNLPNKHAIEALAAKAAIDTNFAGEGQ
ncbi:1-phosphofructokinase [Novosphingobium sp. Rr 2-17]|uniref:1-phosphofructokinase n=1 Tax=Novosphingobium sp. Rr 2-17 TaxID=555793 RepID=UPI000269A496|nr:1-phosphofructokinase [Novosphingobium sp. Rr 2-17]EIZ80889.1 1-phosphofructokinase [Novosphingobium sp. Rr 2-17]